MAHALIRGLGASIVVVVLVMYSYYGNYDDALIRGSRSSSFLDLLPLLFCA